MSNNKKISLLFILVVILPIVLLFLFGYFRGMPNSTIETSTGNLVSSILILVSIAGCGLISFLNHKFDLRKSYWYTIPFIIAVVLALIFFMGNSLSHFGF